MTGGQPINEYVWVAAGAVMTCALGLALLYWIDQEWRTLDERRSPPDAPPAPPTDDHPPDPGDEGSAPPT